MKVEIGKGYQTLTIYGDQIVKKYAFGTLFQSVLTVLILTAYILSWIINLVDRFKWSRASWWC